MQLENQRLKYLYLLKIFTERTDDDHSLTVKEIIDLLRDYGVSSNRKTLYSDFEELRKFGVDIISEKRGHDVVYHVGQRRFELPELKLLVDSVQSAKFLSERKSNELIKKIESLGSVYDAKHLQRQVVIAGRIKSMNESIYYNIDILHEAINANKQIQFHYYRWNIQKKMELRKEGEYYQVSPWGLMWDDENYYLVAYDAEESIIKHYRVDKMLHITILEENRVGNEAYKAFNLPKYTKSLFGMFGGEIKEVLLQGRNDIVGVVIDRFGKDIAIKKVDNEHFTASVKVAVSPQFIGWVVAIGDGLKIIGPTDVVDMMRNETKRLNDLYS